ncbi:MAG: UDP-N-acetylmuramoyl-tripeptide--D-alanyl-D-alanine ligase [Candidatus Limnocylindrales bacterium]
MADRADGDGERRTDGFRAEELAAVAGGRLLRGSSRLIRGAAVDSRRVGRDQAFIALAGARTDGHRFLVQAAQAGAAAVIVTRAPTPTESGALATSDVAVIVVDDGIAALGAMAASWRDRFTPLMVAVTGSYAKTSTKEAAATVLAARLRTLKSEGNENNEIGLPLTLLRLGAEHEAVVVEMGMYVAGDIAALAAIAMPSIGVVTAVSGVHLERAGSLATIELEKGRLVEALPVDGTAILNADDPAVRRMAGRTRARVLSYGFAPDADVTAAETISLGAQGMRFLLSTPTGEARVQTPALGRLGIHNALAAAAVGHVAGLEAAVIGEALAAGFGAPHRTTMVEAGAWRILDDSYNASPESMIAVLDVLASMPARRVAVLGEMLELGPNGPEGHRRVGRHAVEVADLLIAVGAGGALIADGARRGGRAGVEVLEASDTEAALDLLRPRLRVGDTILVKGSRAVELDRLIEPLVSLGRSALEMGT